MAPYTQGQTAESGLNATTMDIMIAWSWRHLALGFLQELLCISAPVQQDWGWGPKGIFLGVSYMQAELREEQRREEEASKRTWTC